MSARRQQSATPATLQVLRRARNINTWEGVEAQETPIAERRRIVNHMGEVPTAIMRYPRTEADRQTKVAARDGQSLSCAVHCCECHPTILAITSTRTIDNAARNSPDSR